MSSNAEVLMRAFASDWGKGKPPALEGAMDPDAELIVPESMPDGGGVFAVGSASGNGSPRIFGSFGPSSLRPRLISLMAEKKSLFRSMSKARRTTEPKSRWTMSGSTNLKMARSVVLV